jgi:sphingomyelin phosphodiesterase acid-like 3
MHGSSARSWIIAALLLCVVTSAWCAAPRKHAAPSRTVDVVMLSDLHFDPLYDPAEASELREAPVSEWATILSRPASPSRAADFNALQTSCGVRGADSPWSLVRASLQQAKLREPKPLFVTVSGDLLAHGFPCKLRALAPRATAEDVSAFSAKTVAFLALQLRKAFPAAPIYFALGNNDSGCGDYRETPDSAFLRSVGTSFAEDLHDPASRAALLSTFSKFGDYSVALPSPIKNTRLIVVQDIFGSTHFESCDGHADAGAAAAQIDWLHAQLAEARANGEQVWVMAHIPPGVDIYASFHRYLFAPGEACNVKKPQMFLKTSAIGDTIADFSDVVRLAIFAHTHMDEIKLLENAQGGAVPAKLVPSISPINGNDPAFLVAQVLPQNATMKDYTVYAAANAQGTAWAREYQYSTAYGLPDFSAASVQKLTSDLIADKTGESRESREYERYFLAGGGTFATLGLQRLWPAYSCSLQERNTAAFHSCMCPESLAKP